MNRQFTNIIRFLLDECLPAIIRDNKYFMTPFFYLAYRGKDINTVMNFKKLIYKFSVEEYKNFYTGLNSISRNRLTDLNRQSIKFIVDEIEGSTSNIIDIGCGSGFLLKYLYTIYPYMIFSGVDIIDNNINTPFNYIQCNIEQLSISNNSYDIVICCHTLEHVIELKQAVSELIRICRKKLIIVVPCQRYFYYTIDEHINFFTHEQQIHSLMGIEKSKIKKIEKLWGDWILVVDCEEY